MNSKQSYLIFVLAVVALIIRFLFSFTAARGQTKFRTDGTVGPKFDLESEKGAPRINGPTRERKANAPIEPLRLTGHRFDGTAYEILGVPPTATDAEILRAYKEMMKRFHPDKIGPPGSREWKDAQGIAEAINRAREELLVRPSQSRRK